MKYRLSVAMVVCWSVLLAGCTAEREFRPGTDFPEWAYDKPVYQEPAKEPVPFMEAGEGLPDIYYNNQSVVFIKRPDRPDLRMAPRPAVFSTKDNAQSWKKEGNFGLEQAYFPFVATEDATYGICIVGVHRPDLAPANLQIQHVQVVDTEAPQIEVSISPEEAPYWTGQRIRLTWKITDAHLVKAPGKLYSKVVYSDKPTPWELLKTGMVSSGTISVIIEQIPQLAEGVVFRIEAADKMGSIGVAYSKTLEVLPSVPWTTVKEPTSRTFIIPGIEEQPGSAEPTIIPPEPVEGGVEPGTETAPETEPENVPPLSRRSKAPVEAHARPTVAVVLGEGRPRARAVSAKSRPRPRAENQTDAEMAELDKVLAGVSGPVFQGKVHRAPKGRMVAPEPTIATTPRPLPRAAPSAEPSVKTVRIEQAQTRPQRVLGPTPGGVVVARPMEERPGKPVIKVGPVQEQAGQAVAAKDAAEKLELLAPPLIEAAPPGQIEPIVTVRPPAERAPEPIVRVPVEPGPVLEIVPPGEPAVEPRPIVTVKPAPPATTVGPSHGKDRMAKPWERLGERDAAARDFYKYAPTLSNY